MQLNVQVCVSHVPILGLLHGKCLCVGAQLFPFVLRQLLQSNQAHTGAISL
jgi:hypothetical protein